MDFQKITDYRNHRSPFAQGLGIVVEVLAPGRAKAEKTIRDADTNPLGIAHGAVLFALADTACGSAAVSYGCKSVTLSANYNFLRSAMVGDHIIAQATEVKHGATISIYDAVLTNQKGEKIGSGTLTFFCTKEPLDL